jgi:hypothetical protein
MTLVIGWDEVLHQEIAKIISCLESYPKLTAVYHRDRTLVIGWDEVLHQEIAKIISCLESYPKLTAVYHRDRTAAIAVSP